MHVAPAVLRASVGSEWSLCMRLVHNESFQPRLQCPLRSEISKIGSDHSVYQMGSTWNLLRNEVFFLEYP